MVPVETVNAMAEVTTTVTNLFTSLCGHLNTDSSDSHRNNCSEADASGLCFHGGTCFLSPTGEPGCACPDGWQGDRCEIRAFPGSWALRTMEPAEYFAVGAVVSAFAIVIIITIFLFIRYRRARSRNQLSNTLLDSERGDESTDVLKEEQPEKNEKPKLSLTMPPDVTANNNIIGLPRPWSRTRLSAVANTPSVEDTCALTSGDQPPLSEVVTGV